LATPQASICPMERGASQADGVAAMAWAFMSFLSSMLNLR
jgi:hypothetical protein